MLILLGYYLWKKYKKQYKKAIKHFTLLMNKEKYKCKEFLLMRERAKTLVKNLPKNLKILPNDIDLVCSGGGFRGVYFGGVLSIIRELEK